MSLSWLVLSSTWKRVTDGVSECDIFLAGFPSFEKLSFKAHLT